ncbi:ankyrin repeat domain-containing protein [Candidatus Babeliales bacterium]|nr:ankyrin repeat domain-containing protein [Candidatus Babeliales bacterium]
MLKKIVLVLTVLCVGFSSSQAAHHGRSKKNKKHVQTRRAPRIVAGSSGYSVYDLTNKLGEAVYQRDSVGLMRTYLKAGADADGYFQPRKPDDLVRCYEFPYNKSEHILKLAVWSGRSDVVALLLDYGAQVREGYLEKTAAQGDVDVACWLLERGADVNECEHVGGRLELGWTPLYAAVANRQLAMVKFLLSCCNIDVNVVRSSRLCAQKAFNPWGLIVKVGEGVPHGFRLLHDNISCTPLDCAEWLEETEIAEVLRQAGGKTAGQPKKQAIKYPELMWPDQFRY